MQEQERQVAMETYRLRPANALTSEMRRRLASESDLAVNQFGYDWFISFALGPPPRGTKTYAAALARRLREQGFTAFFSEHDAPPGARLDSTLRDALRDSKALVVILNAATLREPRWVRSEVEEFRRTKPNRPVIPISVGGALQDVAASKDAQVWLQCTGMIGLDESDDAVTSGKVSDEVLDRLAVLQKKSRSTIRWRRLKRYFFATFAVLLIAGALAALGAYTNAKRAKAEALNKSAADLAARSRISLERNTTTTDVALMLAAASHRLRPGPDSYAALQDALRATSRLLQVASLPADMRVAKSEHGTVVAVAGSAIQVITARDGRLLDSAVTGHSGSISSVAVSHDGKTVASADVDGKLLLTSAESGQALAGWPRKLASPATTLAFSADDRMLASGLARGQLALWSVSDARMLSSEASDGERVTWLAVNRGGTQILFKRAAGGVHAWETNTPTVRALPVSVGGWLDAAASPDGSLIVTTDNTLTARVWDAAMGRRLGPDLSRRSTGFAFRPDGAVIAIGSGDDVVLLDAATGAQRGSSLTGHKDRVRLLAFSPDGETLVSASEGDDLSLRLWDTARGKPRGNPLLGHRALITSVAFSPDGTRLASGGNDAVVRLWDTGTGELVEEFLGHAGPVADLAFSGDGGTLISFGEDKTARLWSATKSRSPGLFANRWANSPTSIALRSDGRVVASGNEDTSVVLWDMHMRRPVGGLHQAHTESVTAVAFDPLGHTLASGSKDRTVRLWDGTTGEPRGDALGKHKDPVTGVAFSPVGDVLVSAGGNQLRVWEVATRRPIRVIETGHRGRIRSVAFSPDGTTVACGSEDGTASNWNVKDGKRRGPILETKQSALAGLAFCDQGRTLAAASGTIVYLWDMEKPTSPGRTLQSNGIFVKSVACNDRLLASGGEDGSVRLWDSDSGQPIGSPLQGHQAGVISIAITADGMHVASIDSDGNLGLWDSPAAWIGLVCSRLVRNLSGAEWKKYAGDVDYVSQCPELPRSESQNGK